MTEPQYAGTAHPADPRDRLFRVKGFTRRFLVDVKDGEVQSIVDTPPAGRWDAIPVPVY